MSNGKKPKQVNNPLDEKSIITAKREAYPFKENSEKNRINLFRICITYRENRKFSQVYNALSVKE